MTIDLKEGFATDAQGNKDTLISILGVNAGRGGDDITMDDNGGAAFGRAGNDTFRTGSGVSYIVMGRGDDRVIGGRVSTKSTFLVIWNRAVSMRTAAGLLRTA